MSEPAEVSTQDHVLAQLREQITDTDRAIVDAINRRLKLVAQIRRYKESRGLPFLVAVNQFQDTAQHPPEQVREALKIPAAVQVITCDARSPESTKQTLIAAAEHALAELHAPRPRKA